MHFSNQEKRSSHLPNNPHKPKLIENKPHNHMARDYEDEQASLALKGSDSSEVRDLKGKIKLVMTKLTSVKKEKD